MPCRKGKRCGRSCIARVRNGKRTKCRIPDRVYEPHEFIRNPRCTRGVSKKCGRACINKDYTCRRPRGAAAAA